MKISIELLNRQSLFPQIIHYIHDIEDKYVFNKEYNIKHPIDNFCTSIVDVFTRYSNLFEIMEDYKSNWNDNAIAEKYIESIELLLSKLSSFYDNCICIILAFYKPDEIKMQVKGAANKLKGKPFFENFYSETISEANSWKIQFNKIKHHGSRIRPFHGEVETEIMLGYYIESFRNDIPEPDLEIHKLYSNVSTAFTLNHKLRQYISQVYEISNRLLKHLKIFFRKSYDVKIPKRTKIIKDEIISSVFSYLSEMPLLFFPDECLLPYYKIKKEYDKVLLSYPHKDRIINYPRLHYFGSTQVPFKEQKIITPYL